ncbi:potassium ion channel Yvc1 [Ophiocordyceps camponoti-floridani]|uniref:Potassium ion channel Yvc1 n=1 Tax=Ophiocordyceps camponoti-floridani TaxID=2030778 RepID=A0A8H4Q3L8_9HYPO|nr:potassium ion channel Yvc1 [Ophiocordyceps camponoti-floridani]
MPDLSRWSALDRALGFSDRSRPRRDDHWLREEERALIPLFGPRREQYAVPPLEATKICLRLRRLIQECIPCEMDESRITTPHGRIITSKVLLAAQEAGGREHRSCVAFCLLINYRWFQQEARAELWDSSLHQLRKEACAVVAKAIIDDEQDVPYLMHDILLRRYSIMIDGAPTNPANVIEKAVDLHAIRVIGSSGFQKCIGHLWRGWLVTDPDDPSVFIDYKDRDDTNILVHMDPNRMRVPKYQNVAQLLFSLIYLALYTAAVNTVNPTGVLDGAEVIMYAFTVGFVCDEVVKVYKAGYRILGFWNGFNAILYSFLMVSLVFRIVGLTAPTGSDTRIHYSTLSYNLMSFVAPMFWSRLLLYLDSFKFFGAMLVVLKVMMKESIIFFALLIIIVIGFLQAFIGLDLTDDNVAGDAMFILEAMIKAVLQSPEFAGFESFGPPWGMILYYCFAFVVMIILLNILIALYNSAYSDIYDNADDEYLALFSQKTLQFIRAPDENVYIAPLNLVELVVSGLLEWWMDKKTYERINDYIMGFLYSPLLFATAYFEMRVARDIRRNRARGEEDDDVVEEWEQLSHELDFEADGWVKTCEAVKPNLEDDAAAVEVRRLRAEFEELKTAIKEMMSKTGGGSPKDSAADDPSDGQPDGQRRAGNGNTSDRDTSGTA